MALLKKTWKLGTIMIAVFLTFSGTIFLSAFFASFAVNVQNVDVTLAPLQSSDTEFTVSFAPSSGLGDELYHIAPRSLCNQNEYDDYGNCIDPVPNLCPYLSLELKDSEDSTPTPDWWGVEVTGKLNNPDDPTDIWNLSIRSPCFEGECPLDYDEFQNGAPLPQSQKGQTFKCNLFVETGDEPVLVKNYLEKSIAYADTFLNTVEVSAVLTGELPGCTIDCFSNVLFLPGLEASRLYKQKTVLGFPVEDQLWEPNGNKDVEDLYLNTDGTSMNPDIYTRDIIKETNTPFPAGAVGQNIYKSFSNMMDEFVTDGKINSWQEYAYDWRQDVNNVVDNGTKYENNIVLLIDTLQSLVDSSKNNKVTIVAHSNGGLLAKAFLQKLQDDKTAGVNNLIDGVDVLIMVAVPEIGTAKAVSVILHGYDQRTLLGWLMDEIHARELGRNMLGAFGLLPSKEYINHASASPVTFVDTAIPSGVTTKLVQAFGSAISSYAEYKDFLFGNEGRTNPAINQTNLPINLSESLFSQAESLHDSIDAWIPPASLRVIEVAGWGLDTIASFEYYPRVDCIGPSCIFVLDEKPRFTSDGDKTVVVPSAHYTSFLGSAEKYWVNFKNYNTLFKVNREHKDILEVSSLNDLIRSVINKTDIVFDTVLKNSEPTDTSNRLRLSIHSPVTLDAYDIDGNHTGKICPSDSEFCYAEENILNSSYLEFGEGKYINLPEDQMFKVKLQGTAIGTFTYDSEKVLPSGTSTTSSFIDIPVTTQTQAEITLNPSTGVPQLALDVTGDGVTDFTIQPNNEFDPILYLKIMKETINSFDLPQAKKHNLNKKIDNIIKAIQKGKINKAELKAEKFKSFLEKKLSKPDPKKPKPKRLSRADAQLLLDMLNKLLDNIN